MDTAALRRKYSSLKNLSSKAIKKKNEQRSVALIGSDNEVDEYRIHVKLDNKQLAQAIPKSKKSKHIWRNEA